MHFLKYKTGRNTSVAPTPIGATLGPAPTANVFLEKWYMQVTQFIDKNKLWNTDFLKVNLKKYHIRSGVSVLLIPLEIAN